MAIYISSGLYSSGSLDSADTNADNPVIGYDNIVNFGGITADSEKTDYPASNLSNVSTGEYWESNSTSAQNIAFTATAQTVNYVGIAGHNLVGSTYKLQYKVNPGDSYTDLFTAVVAGDNSAIMHMFESVVAGYFNLVITPASGVYPKISAVFIGEYLQLQRRIYVGHTPIVDGYKTKYRTGKSDSGQYLGRVILSEELGSSVSQENISPSFFRSNIRPFREHAKTKPFFFAWRPATYPAEVGYCWMSGDMDISNSLSNGMMRFSFSIGGHAPWMS